MYWRFIIYHSLLGYFDCFVWMFVWLNGGLIHKDNENDNEINDNESNHNDSKNGDNYSGTTENHN